MGPAEISKHSDDAPLVVDAPHLGQGRAGDINHGEPATGVKEAVFSRVVDKKLDDLPVGIVAAGDRELRVWRIKAKVGAAAVKEGTLYPIIVEPADDLVLSPSHPAWQGDRPGGAGEHRIN